MDDRPDDLISLREAAELVGRSSSTIRRWISGERLRKWEGTAPAHGGHSSTLVRKAAVLAVMGTSASAHRSATSAHEHLQASAAVSQASNHEHSIQLTQLEGEIAVLRAQLDAARVRLEYEAGTLRAQLDADREAHEAVLRDLRQSLHEARSDVTDWRDRHDQVAVELRTLRETTGRSWWSRLLPGPS